ncbi:hypothetical protein C7M84_010781 [Penaeus vannamei]|uniref:G-protein coupled receptors family 1 profile domain-containing protein n=1 Tax=Penaeus vannamei TaxID=6689 RepID=A0A423T333_PENVA|nr:hypothetical protein C7M84_010781 [Penaeus vannamei]
MHATAVSGSGPLHPIPHVFFPQLPIFLFTPVFFACDFVSAASNSTECSTWPILGVLADSSTILSLHVFADLAYPFFQIQPASQTQASLAGSGPHAPLGVTPRTPLPPLSEAEEVVEPEDWKRQRSESSTAMDEIETTYVPTALVMDNTKYASQGRDVGKAAGCCRGLASCIKRTVDREDASTQAAGHRAGYHTPPTTRRATTLPATTPGYHTPGSVETSLPSSVSRCTSLNYIREPMSATPTRYRQNSMIPLVERAERPDHHHHHHHHHHHGASTLPRAESTLGVGARSQVGGRLQARSHSSDSVYTILIRLPHDPSQDGPLHPPSILMIEEEGQEGGGAGGAHKLRFDRGTSPLARRGDSVCSDPSGQATRVECSLHPGGPEGTSPAAKTLSAILLTFIVTWTPYNVLVLLKTLMACNADDCIPRQLWDFSYYLCYINSTINPMCYALCNAAFRRTYVRILTCKWHSRRKQGVQRGYYS